jgi:hypothetical protein
MMRDALASALLPLGILAIAGAVATTGPRARAETAASDPQAVRIADQVMAALGGKARWDKARYFRWTFEASVNDTLRPGRRHLWDKYTGWHRVDGTNRAGQAFCYIENLNDSTGMAWVNGQPIEGDSLKKLMHAAHGQWINDSYWFLMPYKLRDPGVTLKYDGEVKDSTGAVEDRLALSFENVGMTPGDRYWVYVNRATHRIVRWDHLLQGNPPPPTPWTLEGWEQHGALWFATAHRNTNRIVYTRAVAMTAPGPSEFKAP